MSPQTQASSRQVDGPLLKVTDLRTAFRTDRGLVKSVDGVSFTLDRGKSLGIVGESGSGKTVLSRSITQIGNAAPCLEVIAHGVAIWPTTPAGNCPGFTLKEKT